MLIVDAIILYAYESSNSDVSDASLFKHFSFRCLFERLAKLQMPSRNLICTRPMTRGTFAEQHLSILKDNHSNTYLRSLVFHTTEYTNTPACAIVGV